MIGFLFLCSTYSSFGATWTSEYYTATDQAPYHIVETDLSNPINRCCGDYDLTVNLERPFSLFGTRYENLNANSLGWIRFSDFRQYFQTSYGPWHMTGCQATRDGFTGINVFYNENFAYHVNDYGGVIWSQFFEECPRSSQAIQSNEPCTVVFFNQSWVHTVDERVQFQAVLYHNSNEIAMQYTYTGTVPAEVGVWYEDDLPASLPIFCKPNNGEGNTPDSLLLKGKTIRISPLFPRDPSPFPTSDMSHSPFIYPPPPPRSTTTGFRMFHWKGVDQIRIFFCFEVRCLFLAIIKLW